MILVALLLNMAGTDDTLAYLSRTLARSCLGGFLETERCYLYLEVDTVKEIMVCLFHSLCTCVFEI